MFYPKGLVLLTFICFTRAQVPSYVIPVKSFTYVAEFQCVADPKLAPVTYSWYRQNQQAFPEGVEAEEDRLGFFKLTPDLYGMYICNVTHQHGNAVASFYLNEEENLLHRNEHKGLLTLLKYLLDLFQTPLSWALSTLAS